jgi:hypothetical protein
MKHAWLVALAMGLLLPASAGARKECRPAEAPAAEDAAQADARWPHGATSSWVHEGDSRWVHEPDEAEGDAGADAADAGSGWVHEGVEYGWWSAPPDAALSEVDPDGPAAPGAGKDGEEPLEDCTVSRERNECMVLANQLASYEFRLGLAKERDDLLWEESLRETIERLEARGEQHDCAWVEPSLREKIAQTVDAVLRAAIVAAQVYAKLQSLGLY